MKKSFSRFLMFMLVLVIIFPSCSKKTGTEGTSDVIKIGVLANLTGWFAAIDANNVNEVKAVAQIINDEGGLKVGDKSYKIELDIQDGQSDATGIRNAAQILANNGCKYVIETNDFWVEGALDIFEKGKIMNVQAQNNMDFRAMGPKLKYTYTFCNGAAAQYDSAIQAILKNYPQVKSIVYCENDDGNTATKIVLVKSLCQKHGLNYVDKPVKYDANATDFSAIALQVTKTGAGAFIGNASPNNIAAILKEVRNSGSNMVCAAIVGMSAGVIGGIAGPDASNNVFTLGADLTTESNNSPIFWKYYNKVKETYGEKASSAFTGNFANSFYVLTNLIKGCESVEVGDVMDYWDSIKTVDTIYGEAKIGGMKIYSCNHLVAAPDPVSMLKNGKIVFGGWFKTELQ